jgi:hypothetical protein
MRGTRGVMAVRSSLRLSCLVQSLATKKRGGYLAVFPWQQSWARPSGGNCPPAQAPIPGSQPPILRAEKDSAPWSATRSAQTPRRYPLRSPTIALAVVPWLRSGAGGGVGKAPVTPGLGLAAWPEGLLPAPHKSRCNSTVGILRARAIETELRMPPHPIAVSSRLLIADWARRLMSAPKPNGAIARDKSMVTS